MSCVCVSVRISIFTYIIMSCMYVCMYVIVLELTEIYKKHVLTLLLHVLILCICILVSAFSGIDGAKEFHGNICVCLCVYMYIYKYIHTYIHQYTCVCVHVVYIHVSVLHT